ncbi:site-specific DNA-methyltransferase [Leptospira weilii]|uniref:site-specific DNA-methyltransferase n=1 Tax=Leptospira weilii TaxID=28184 RepID=UPI00077396A8|nr:site-specific DNA-methyltransferase [Leptospira weilii]
MPSVSIVIGDKLAFRYFFFYQKVAPFRGFECNEENTNSMISSTVSVFINKRLVFYKKLPTYNPQKYAIDPKFHVKGKQSLQTAKFINIRGTKPLNYQYLEDGTRYPDSVLCFPSESGKGMHPTQKPVSLLNFLILSYTNKFDTVLDHCMGSGTTGVACVKNDRRFIGIEFDKGYFNLAKSRISKAKKEKVETLFSDLALSS